MNRTIWTTAAATTLTLSSPRAFSQANDIPSLLVQISENNIYNRTAALSATSRYCTMNDPPSNYGNALNSISKELSALGYTPRYENVTVPNSSYTYKNMYVDKIGFAYSKDLIEITAHLDSADCSAMQQGPCLGAMDNASGAAVVAELARVLKGYKNRHTIRFVFFAAEEEGALGSSAHVAKLRGAGYTLKMALNIDTVAMRRADGTACNDIWYRPTLNDGVFCKSSGNCAPDVSELDRVATLFNQVDAAYSIGIQCPMTPQVGVSDEVAYWMKGQNAVSSLGGFQLGWTALHTPNDTMAFYDGQVALGVAKQNLAVALTLDKEDQGRLLWFGNGSRIRLYDISLDSKLVKQLDFIGGDEGWAPVNYADNRILWKHPNGSVALWNLDGDGNYLNYVSYPLQDTWTPKNYSANRILWTRANEAVLWQLNADGSFRNYIQYPIQPADWAAVNYADNRILWAGPNGQAALWLLSPDGSGNCASLAIYPEQPGWTPVSYADNKILWTSPGGNAHIWILDANGNYLSTSPFMQNGWTAVSHSVDRLLWVNDTSKDVALWEMTSAGGFARYTLFSAPAGFGPVNFSR